MITHKIRLSAGHGVTRYFRYPGFPTDNGNEIQETRDWDQRKTGPIMTSLTHPAISQIEIDIEAGIVQ
jgi:hypothetical protein